MHCQVFFNMDTKNSVGVTFPAKGTRYANALPDSIYKNHPKQIKHKSTKPIKLGRKPRASGEMVGQVLVCKPGALNLDLQALTQKPGLVAHACEPAVPGMWRCVGVETGGFLGPSGQSVKLNGRIAG